MTGLSDYFDIGFTIPKWKPLQDPFLRTWWKRNVYVYLAGSLATLSLLFRNPRWADCSGVSHKSIWSTVVYDGINSAQPLKCVNCWRHTYWTFVLNGDQNDIAAVKNKNHWNQYAIAQLTVYSLWAASAPDLKENLSDLKIRTKCKLRKTSFH